MIKGKFRQAAKRNQMMPYTYALLYIVLTTQLQCMENATSHLLSYRMQIDESPKKDNRSNI